MQFFQAVDIKVHFSGFPVECFCVCALMSLSENEKFNNSFCRANSVQWRKYYDWTEIFDFFVFFRHLNNVF